MGEGGCMFFFGASADADRNDETGLLWSVVVYCGRLCMHHRQRVALQCPIDAN